MSLHIVTHSGGFLAPYHTIDWVTISRLNRWGKATRVQHGHTHSEDMAFGDTGSDGVQINWVWARRHHTSFYQLSNMNASSNSSSIVPNKFRPNPSSAWLLWSARWRHAGFAKPRRKWTHFVHAVSFIYDRSGKQLSTFAFDHIRKVYYVFPLRRRMSTATAVGVKKKSGEWVDFRSFQDEINKHCTGCAIEDCFTVDYQIMTYVGEMKVIGST